MAQRQQTPNQSTPLGAAVVADDLRGFKVWSRPVRAMPRSHIHSDIEINLVLRGEVEYFFGGRFQTWCENTLAVFWAGVPHALPRSKPGTEMVWCVVPLAWFLQWALPSSATETLLRGQVLLQENTGELERASMLRWSREFGDFQTPHADAEDQKIVALEVEALLRRLVRDAGGSSLHRNGTPRSAAGASQVEKLSAFISRHYREEIAIRDIARAVNLHPNYAMQLFREKCGLSLWEYVLRLRVSHAQYLLLTTNRKLADIARDSGFISPSRFYAAFEKYSGCAPRAWRERMREKVGG
jgi:AraC-like DNA-binding protein